MSKKFDLQKYKNHINNIIIIQKIVRGFLYRITHLPNIFYLIQKYLETKLFEFSVLTKDGRINSYIDEDKIIDILKKHFTHKIIIPDKIRKWYDILVYDSIYGWQPTNIKTTTSKTSDNTGNLAMCVHSYTDKILDLHNSYDNGEMSKILFTKLYNKQYNKIHKKDYYFIVLNKTNSKEIIINSIKGLSNLTPNINNLPFQVKWCNNKIFCYDIIDNKIKMFIKCLKKPKPSWKEIFMSNIRTIDI
jgi:hypothetical protein